MCNYIVSKLSLAIASARLDIVDLNSLTHIVILDFIKQLVS